jgi:hypothetical protein
MLMDEQKKAPERRRRATTWVERRRKLERKDRAFDAIHESCVAYTARRVLRDCDWVIRRMPTGDVNQAAGRQSWFAAVALLRAVGHALKNEDAARSVYLREAIEAAWQKWKTNFYASQMFYGFIEDERNALLKEYRFESERKIYVEEAAGVGQRLVLICGQAVAPVAALNMAWKWWQVEIRRIEGHATDLRQGPLGTR